MGHIQLNHNVDVPGDAERSQRSRSIAFLAYGVMAATSLTRYHRGESVTLYVPENGFISLNPPLTVDRLGSLSTRTTHPTFLSAFQSLLQQAQLRINIENPLRLKTKGEVLLECRDQAYLRQYAHTSTSCGRYARNGFQHCGRCIPCIIRRAAFRKWGERDRTGYRYSKLGQRDKDHALYDDVRSLATALCTVRADGVDQWMSGAVDSRIVGDTAPFKRVVERSILELDGLFEALRVR